MATGLTIIEAALRMIGKLRVGQTSSTVEQSAGLEALNALLGNLSAEELPLYQLTTDNHSLTGPASYTWGSGGTWATARPTRIRSAVTSRNGINYPALIIDSHRWDLIVDKTAAGLYAESLWPDGGYPLLTVNLWPAPVTGATLIVHSYKPLSSVAAVGTTVDLPPGYEYALKTLLALAIAPEYEVNPANIQGLLANAQGAKAAITRVNAAVIGPDSLIPPAPPVGGNQ